MATPEQIAIVERWFHDLFARGNVSALDELAAPDFVVYDPDGSERVRGHEPFRAWLRWYLASFTDAEWTIHELITEGDKVAVRYSGRTTYRGGLFDIPSKNQRVKEIGVLIFRITEGKVRELWSALCDLELVLSLGAVPVPKERLASTPE